MTSARIIPMQPVSWGHGVTKPVTLLEITSPSGKTGLGSAYTSQGQVAKAWDAFVENPNALYGQSDKDRTVANSAIDIALWDLLGKEKGLPVCELIGGRRHEKILAYASVEVPFDPRNPENGFAEKIKNTLDLGFKALKLYMAGFGHRGPTKTESEWDALEYGLLKLAREIAGPGIKLMLDVYGSNPDWTPDYAWAKKTSRILAELDYFWFEEPLSPENHRSYQQLTAASPVAISGGEDLIQIDEFVEWMRQKRVEIIQPDTTRVGGISVMAAIRDHAKDNRLTIIPHGWNTAVGLAADLQLQTTLDSNETCMVEYMPTPHLTEPLSDDPFHLDDEGKITVPAGPGLGVQLQTQQIADQAGVFGCDESVITIDSPEFVPELELPFAIYRHYRNLKV